MKRLLYFIAAFTAGGILLLLGFHVAPGTSSASHKQQHADITATTQKAPVILVPEPSDKENLKIMCSAWIGDEVLVECPNGTKPDEWRPVEGEGSFPYGDHRLPIMIHVVAATEKGSVR